MVKRIALVVTVLLFLPALAHAQFAGSPGRATFGPNVRTTGAPQGTQTQTGSVPIFVEGFVGAQLDTPDDWFFLGGDARLRVPGRLIEINPRLTFQPFEGGSALQIDVNALVELELAIPNKFRPYVGFGGALLRTSFDEASDTAFGLNLAGGVRFDTEGRSRIEPFAHVQYTIVRDRLNPFTIAVGVTIPLR